MPARNGFGSRLREKGQEIVVDLKDMRGIVSEAVAEKFDSLKSGASNALTSLKSNAASMARDTGDRATAIVRESPWKSMAGAAAVGLLAGLFIGRR